MASADDPQSWLEFVTELERTRTAPSQRWFELFLDRYAAWLTWGLRRRGLQEADVDEIMQEICVKVLRYAPQLDLRPGPLPLRSWLSRVRDSCTGEFFRRNLPPPSESHVDPALTPVGMTGSAEAGLLTSSVSAWLAEQTESDRIALAMVAEGKTSFQIAATLNSANHATTRGKEWTAANVRARIRTLRDRLARWSAWQRIEENDGEQ
jgi:DNA-directed RNA polymerase specialized sigma24 family protein